MNGKTKVTKLSDSLDHTLLNDSPEVTEHRKQKSRTEFFTFLLHCETCTSRVGHRAWLAQFLFSFFF